MKSKLWIAALSMGGFALVCFALSFPIRSCMNSEWKYDTARVLDRTFIPSRNETVWFTNSDGDLECRTDYHPERWVLCVLFKGDAISFDVDKAIWLALEKDKECEVGELTSPTGFIWSKRVRIAQ